jgi:hypothetical protein
MCWTCIILFDEHHGGKDILVLIQTNVPFHVHAVDDWHISGMMEWNAYY